MKTPTLYVILLVALVSRAALLAVLWKDPGDRIYTPDSQDYIQLSDSLEKWGSFERDGRPEIFRTPGYPLLLAFAASWQDSWWRAVLVFQIVLDVALVYLTFLLGWTLVEERVGLIAAALLAIEPVAVASCLRILSDSLYAFLFTLAVLLLVHHLRSNRWWALLIAALMLGAACYVRPVGLAMAMVAVLMVLLVGGKQRWKRAVVLASIVALSVRAWVVRNTLVADYVGFSNFTTDALYYFAAPEVVAETDKIPPEEARAEMKKTGELINIDKTPGQAAAARKQEALRIITEHPWLYVRLHLQGSLGFFLPAVTDLLHTVGLTTERTRHGGRAAHAGAGGGGAVLLCRLPLGLALGGPLTHPHRCAVSGGGAGRRAGDPPEDSGRRRGCWWRWSWRRCCCRDLLACRATACP